MILRQFLGWCGLSGFVQGRRSLHPTNEDQNPYPRGDERLPS
jgi:hypothetical protein